MTIIVFSFARQRHQKDLMQLSALLRPAPHF